MPRRSMITIALMSISFASSAQSHLAAQPLVDTLSENLSIQYQVDSNLTDSNGLPCQKLGADWALCNQSTMTLTNGGTAIKSKNWSLYIHSVRIILKLDTDQFSIQRITGDLYEIKPTSSFKGIESGESLDIPVIGEYWQLFESDFMPRAFVSADNATPKVLTQMDTEDLSQFVAPIEAKKLKRVSTDNNTLVTPEVRYQNNADLSLTPVNQQIIPTPHQLIEGNGSLDIRAGIDFTSLPIDQATLSAIESRAQALGLSKSGSIGVYGEVDKTALAKEIQVSGGYKLTINENGIHVFGYDDAGLYYAMQSLFSLIDLDDPSQIPYLEISDAPRYQYRGVMVDVARNFHSKQAIIKTLDQMSAYKLNKLHLHLTDDEGWRLEIPGLPELTDIGAKRCFDKTETECLLPQLGSGPDSNNMGSGHFSRADYIEILRYAAARHIEIIPEIDMPAHARAAVVAMEARYNDFKAQGKLELAEEYRLIDPKDDSNVTTVQFYDRKSFINPCLESSHHFVTKVVSEVQAMHSEAGVPLTTWHFGGDEAKNIKLLGGHQDRQAAQKVAGQGEIDLSNEHHPFEKSPKCQQLLADTALTSVKELPSYFAKNVAKIAKNKGVGQFQAWQDGLKTATDSGDFATETTRVNFWDTLYWGGTASAYEWAKKGYQVIISNPDYLYMDFPYEFDPKERGYYWATRSTNTRKMFSFAPENLPQNAETSLDRDGNGFEGKGTIEAPAFYGMSAQLWSETVRTDDQYEYMVFPRVLAAAERAWHKGSWETPYTVGRTYSQDTQWVNKEALAADFNRFANILGQRELAKLAKVGIQYRLPVPGAILNNGKLEMNSAFPGIQLQYSLNQGQDWLNYESDTAPTIHTDVWLRSIDRQGQRSSRITILKL
ncbi:beta-N-acetylhexosaminidase [Vibrio nomapromontoriensis]|uniref:beta-N-acetylhexosaminidase n=1 Tax=Vibrio nomapromontoriensis TaxID=2910246 RepID=UPI003D0DC65E